MHSGVKVPQEDWQLGSADLTKNLLSPTDALCVPPLLSNFNLALRNTPKNPQVSKSWIFHCKRKENKTLVHTLRLLLLSLGASWLSPFSFSALRAPPNLVPPGPRVAPLHRCPHLVAMAPCCTDTVPPQVCYTLWKRLQGSRYHHNLTITVV